MDGKVSGTLLKALNVYFGGRNINPKVLIWGIMVTMPIPDAEEPLAES